MWITKLCMCCFCCCVFGRQATTVFENSDVGDILCAVCPNSKIFITAGTSTVSSPINHNVYVNGNICVSNC